MTAKRSSKPKTGNKEVVVVSRPEEKKPSKMTFRTATEEDYRKRAYDTVGTFFRFENGKLKS